MRPPICSLCPTRASRDGEWIAFADYASLPQGMTGHPRGLEFFCTNHLPGARTFTHLKAAAALTELRRPPWNQVVFAEPEFDAPAPPAERRSFRQWVRAVRDFF